MSRIVLYLFIINCIKTHCLVSYEARDLGVTRHMRGKEALKACPSLQLVQVPTMHGKADITVYRKAGEDVVRVLSSLFK